MRIKTGDIVKVLAGKDRNKTGKVVQVFPEALKVVVDGVNKAVKNLRARSKQEPGRKVDFFAPINISNVELICGKCQKATRVKMKFLADGKKVRVCGKCKENLE